MLFPPLSLIRSRLESVISDKEKQGHETQGLSEELKKTPESYDAYFALAKKLTQLPIRKNYPYVEPDSWEEILKECASDRPLSAMAPIRPEDSARRVETAFLSSVCGCILGKPLEFNPTLEMIRKAGEQTGEWPIRDYVSVRLLDAIGKRHGSWAETTRNNIAYIAPDDDINYTLLGMLILEKHGIGFTRRDLKNLWFLHLPISVTFGPERTTLLKAGVASYQKEEDQNPDEWADFMNPKDEFCGALIRADAYGYACPGRPALAAELAFKDASFTHRKTGVYGAMFVAAAIALAQVEKDRLKIFETALKFIPQCSRFHKITSHCLEIVGNAKDWLSAYDRIHELYGEYAHCNIYQEVGTLINSLRFAEDIGDGFCKQVMQGNDTDSFGATAGSLLGAYFGPGYLDERWLRPFNDDIRTALAWFFDRSLSELARRMGRLPKMIALEIEAAKKNEPTEADKPKKAGKKGSKTGGADAGI